MLCLSLRAGPQAATDVAPSLRIQILNGMTGRPVANRHLVLIRKDGRRLEGNGAGKTTDGEGYAAIPNADVALSDVVVSVDLYRPCSKTGKHEFSLVKVRGAGVVSENSCRSRITLFPQAGTLIFFVREETFLEKMRRR
ncbi:MAG: hypothetical protein M3R43_05200 [Acidobacteriota bacterium]|nr:hypothetical protein [Acidobacteriota bacterium]